MAGRGTRGWVVVCVAALLAMPVCESLRGSLGTDPTASETTAAPAGEDLPDDCYGLWDTSPPELSWGHHPFAIVTDDCELVVQDGSPGSTQCAEVWQVGALLPEPYVGCIAEAGADPVRRALVCGDSAMEGAWVYYDMAAHEGEGIRDGAEALASCWLVPEVGSPGPSQ